ncbi:MAG: hypothetical protein LAT65_03150 [Saccharospirillum sp.]|nr:hypothetical protein [Saccharospirillum sp.]
MHHFRWLLQPFTAFFAALLLILNALIGWFWYQPAMAELELANERLGSSLARTLAFDVAAPLQRQDRLSISLLLNRTSEEPLVITSSLQSTGQPLTLTSRPSNRTPEATQRFTHPVHFESELLGQVEVELDQSPTISWQRQARSSAVVFNLLALLSGIVLLYWRSQWQYRSTTQLVEQLAEQVPQWRESFTGPPEHQLRMLVSRLGDAMDRNGQILRTLATSSNDEQAERLLEQVYLAADKGSYCDVALLSVQCHNWDELSRYYEASQLQTVWAGYEQLITRVGELYGGVLLPEGFTLVFGLNDSDQYALNALCAARVLQLAAQLRQSKTLRLQPRFGYALSAGPAFVSRTTKHGLPLPMVAGDATLWLQQVTAAQPSNSIYLAEPVLQHGDVNQSIDASLIRDVTLHDGSRLEIWELDAFTGQRDRLLESQARTLLESL